MNSVPRKLTLGLILAFGAAACGDDVTVQEETPPTPVVRSVVVSPSSATVAAGGTFTFGASVDADAGLARTVTWSSSNTAVANVDANGLATAASPLPAGGVTSICAASTVDAAVKGCAQLTVTPAAAAATVQIDAVTIGCDAISLALAPGGICGLQTPVATNNVFGQVDVQVQVNRPPGSTVTGVKLEVLNAATGAVEDSARMTFSGDFVTSPELAMQATTNRTTFQVQTAKYDLSGAGGSAKVFHPNGQKRIRVSLLGVTSTATAETQLTFRNPNGFHVTSNNPTGNNANGVAVRQNTAAGVSWIGGTGLTITAVPVNYSGVTLSSTAGAFTVNFGSGCNIGAGNLVRTASATVTGGVGSATLAFTPGSGASANDLDLYEMNPACGLLGGEVPFATALDNNGNPFVSVPLGGNFGANNTLNNAITPVIPGLSTVPAFRLDNRPPQGTVVMNFNPNNRQNFWLNDAVVFNALQPTGGGAATSNNMIANTSTAADAGFGGLTFAAKAGTTLAAAIASADITGPQGLAPSANNTTYCLVQYALDGFANRTASPGGAACPANQSFGVDRFNPVVTYTAGSLAANARINTATIGGEFIVTMVDTGAVGNSGMAPLNPFSASISRRNALGTTCVFGTGAGCAEAPADGITVSSTPPTAQSIITANTVVGYFTFTGTARDAAGNTAAAGSRVIAYDNTAPIVSAAAAPATVNAPGYTVSSFISEDLDIWQQWFSVDYAGAPAPLAPIRIGQQTTVVNTFNAATLIHTNFASSQAVSLPLAVQANMAAGLTLQSAVFSNAMSQSNLVTTGAGASPTVTAPTAIALTNMTAFTTPAFVNATHTGVSTGGPTAATNARPATTSIRATATGATAIFNNPFGRVDFYAINQAGTEWRFLGSVPAASATLTDDGLTRTFTYTLSITGSAVGPNVFGPAPATFASSVVAVGMNATGSVGMLSAGSLAFGFTF